MVVSDTAVVAMEVEMKLIQGRHGDTGVVITTIRMPVYLRDEIKEQAARSGRSMNTHLVMVLREAAGGEFGDQAPAARSENAA